MIFAKWLMNIAGMVMTHMLSPRERKPPWAKSSDCKNKAGAIARTARCPRMTPMSPLRSKCVLGPPGTWMGNKLARKNTAVSRDIFGISSLARCLLPKRSKRSAMIQPAIIPGPWINPSGKCTPKIGSKKCINYGQGVVNSLRLLLCF